MVGALHRRSLLTGVGSGLLATLAGCSVLGSDDSGPPYTEPYRIGDIKLRTRDPTSHRLDLLIRRDDDIVHWATHELRAFDPDRDGGTIYTTVVEAAEFGGCTPGFYSLAVRLDNGTQETLRRLSNPQYDGHDRAITIEGGEVGDWAVDVATQTCGGTVTPEESE
jgi:hypothetical protein